MNWKDTVLDDSSIYNNFVCSIDLIVEFGTEGLEGEEYELQFQELNIVIVSMWSYILNVIILTN